MRPHAPDIAEVRFGQLSMTSSSSRLTHQVYTSRSWLVTLAPVVASFELLFATIAVAILDPTHLHNDDR
jgi:hypothetical protein